MMLSEKVVESIFVHVSVYAVLWLMIFVVTPEDPEVIWFGQFCPPPVTLQVVTLSTFQ